MNKRALINHKTRKFLQDLLCYLALTLITLFCVFPLVWIIKTSFETPQYIRNPQIQWVPIQFTLENYRSVLSNPNAQIGRSFLNSLLVSTVSTLIAIVVTVMAGYALSRWKFRGKTMFSVYLLLVNMIPGTLMLISMFVLLIKLGLVNSYAGLILYYISGGLPLATWMLKGYFDSIPVDIEEQAFIDGASRLQTLRRIVAPLALPGVFAVGAYLFLGHWNEYMAATTILQKAELRTLSVQIINFMGFQRTEWGPIMAYSVIAMIPSVFLFILAQRKMISGLTAGFTK
jgi:ABC-type glycerol-3-phosphate transport system permease component